MYNRKYISDSVQKGYGDFATEQPISRTKEETIAFLKATYQLFAGSLLGASAGAYVGLGMLPILAGPLFWILVFVELGLIFAMRSVAKKPTINLIVLFAFTFISGLTTAPLIGYIAGMPGGVGIVANAFFLTSVAFATISMFALTTKKDYTFMGKFLFVSIIILVIASLINIFVGSPMAQLAIASFGAILFSAFILYDTQNIVKGNIETPIEAAMILYLDFINLFVSLLQILGFANSDE